MYGALQLFRVRLQSAAGTVVELKVRAKSSARAETKALGLVSPGAGFQVLPGTLPV